VQANVPHAPMRPPDSRRLRIIYRLSIVAVVSLLFVFGAHAALALWMVQLEIEGLAATGSVGVSLDGNLDFEWSGCCPGECVKIEGGSVGREGVLDVCGRQVSITDWIPRNDSPGEWIGFSYSVTGDPLDRILIKAGPDTFVTEQPATAGSWVHPGGTAGPDAKAISYVQFCCGCVDDATSSGWLAVTNTGTIPERVYLQLLHSGPVSDNPLCGNVTPGLEIVDDGGLVRYHDDADVGAANGFEAGSACDLFPGASDSRLILLAPQLEPGESMQFVLGLEFPGPDPVATSFVARIVGMQWTDDAVPVPDLDADAVGVFQDAGWPADPYGDDDDTRGRGFITGGGVPVAVEVVAGDECDPVSVVLEPIDPGPFVPEPVLPVRPPVDPVRPVAPTTVASSTTTTVASSTTTTVAPSTTTTVASSTTTTVAPSTTTTVAPSTTTTVASSTTTTVASSTTTTVASSTTTTVPDLFDPEPVDPVPDPPDGSASPPFQDPNESDPVAYDPKDDGVSDGVIPVAPEPPDGDGILPPGAPAAPTPSGRPHVD
jgi:hypothetical protein